MSSREELIKQNIALHRAEGVGRVRRVYLKFLQRMEFGSIVEFGSGDPAFLTALQGTARRVGVDANPGLAEKYQGLGLEFIAADLDAPKLDIGLANMDAAVCSDVFEHLIRPLGLLELTARILTKDGVLFSHVPNEFRFNKTVAVMFGRRGCAYHHSCEEHDDLHVRRFTDLGYRAFLKNAYEFNLKITDLYSRGLARALYRLGIKVPFCFEKGPTYISTNSREKFELLTRIKKEIS